MTTDALQSCSADLSEEHAPPSPPPPPHPIEMEGVWRRLPNKLKHSEVMVGCGSASYYPSGAGRCHHHHHIHGKRDQPTGCQQPKATTCDSSRRSRGGIAIILFSYGLSCSSLQASLRVTLAAGVGQARQHLVVGGGWRKAGQGCMQVCVRVRL